MRQHKQQTDQTKKKRKKTFSFRIKQLVERRAESFASLETRPDSPGEFGMQPRVPVAPGVEHYVLDTSLDEVYFALQWLESNLHLSLTIWMEDWTSHVQHKRKSKFPIVIREFSLKS